MGTKRSRQINNDKSAANVSSVFFLLLATQFALCRAGFHYEAPSDCQWTMMNSSSSTSTSMSSSSSSMATTSDGSGSAGHSALPMAGVVGPNDVALHCRLRTINSQFDQTNFSVVPREHTASLTIECSDSLLYQR